MNYDATNIPASYDYARGLDASTISAWMSVLTAYADPRNVDTILDLGCGTGRFTNALAGAFKARVIGVDPSEKMLEQAKAKPAADAADYRLAPGEALPLRNDEVDIVFISMVFHHFDDPYQVAREARRVLQSAGTLFIRTGTREQIDRYAYVPFFPESVSLLHERLPSRMDIRTTLEPAGFKLVAEQEVMQEIAPNWPAYAEKLSAGADSILASLEPHDFERGMRSLRAHAAATGTSRVTESIDLLVFK